MPIAKIRKKRLWFQIALSVFFTTLILIYLTLSILGPRWMRATLLPHVNQSLNGTISVQEISIEPLTTTVGLKNFQIIDVDQNIVFHAKSIDLNLDLWTYLRSQKIVIESVLIDQGFGVIQSNGRGQSTFIQTFSPILKDQTPNIKADQITARLFEIKKISFTNCKVAFQTPDSSHANPLTIGPIEASFSQLDASTYLPNSFHLLIQIPNPDSSTSQTTIASLDTNKSTKSNLLLAGKRYYQKSEYRIRCKAQAVDLNHLTMMVLGLNKGLKHTLDKTYTAINGECNTKGIFTISHPSLSNNPSIPKPSAYELKYDGKIDLTKTSFAISIPSSTKTAHLQCQDFAWQGSIVSNWPYSFDPAINPQGWPSLMLNGQIQVSKLNQSSYASKQHWQINKTDELPVNLVQNETSAITDHSQMSQLGKPQMLWQINLMNIDSFTYHWPQNRFHSNHIKIQQPLINIATNPPKANRKNEKQQNNISANVPDTTQAIQQVNPPKISNIESSHTNNMQKKSVRWHIFSSAINLLTANKITIHNGTVNLNNASLAQTAFTTFTKIESSIAAIDLKNKHQIHLQANAQINQSGQISLQVGTTLSSKTIDGEINLKVQKIPLKPLTEYFATYLGYYINQGSLNLNLPLTIKSNQLTGKAEFQLFDFKLGLPTDSKESIAADLPTAIAILRDRQGLVSGTIPITGNLLNPDFSISQLTTKAIGNLIVRTLTAPIDALALMFGGEPGVDYSTITFISGDFKPLKDPSAKLQVLANTLIARPEINLAITGRINTTLDGPALENRLKLQAMQNDRGNTLFANPNFSDPVHLTGKFNDEQWKHNQHLLLLELAKQRAEWTRHQLVQAYGVPPQQIQTYTQLNNDLFGEPTVHLSMSNPKWKLLTPEQNQQNSDQ